MPSELVATIRLHSPHTIFPAVTREAPVLATRTVDIGSPALATAGPTASGKPAQHEPGSADSAPSPSDSVSPCPRGETEPMPLAWLLDLLQQAMTEVMAGEATPVQKANAVARLGSLYLKACRVTELQRDHKALTQRVAELEQQNAEQARRLAELEQAREKEEPRAVGEATRAPRLATARAQDPRVDTPLTWTPIRSHGSRAGAGKKRAGGTGSAAPPGDTDPRAWTGLITALREELEDCLNKRAATAPDTSDTARPSP
jgi:hypothetical protein